jgi:hypothetical protein
MVDSMNRRELLRLIVWWPLAIKTETGVAHGETTNMTGEGSLERPQKKGRNNQYASSVMKARPKMAPSFLMVKTINCVIDRLKITNRVLSACIRNSRHDTDGRIRAGDLKIQISKSCSGSGSSSKSLSEPLLSTQ